MTIPGAASDQERGQRVLSILTAVEAGLHRTHPRVIADLVHSSNGSAMTAVVDLAVLATTLLQSVRGIDGGTVSEKLQTLGLNAARYGDA